MKPIFPALLIATLTACGSGASSLTVDPHVAAVQAALDRDTLSSSFPYGKQCHERANRMFFEKEYAPYKKLGILSGPAAYQPAGYGPELCWTISWPALVATKSNGYATVVIGKYVADKVGPEQDGPLGTKFSSYNAHFVATDWGRRIIGVGLMATSPPPKTDVPAYFHKDADGNLVASD